MSLDRGATDNGGGCRIGQNKSKDLDGLAKSHLFTKQASSWPIWDICRNLAKNRRVPQCLHYKYYYL